MSKPKAIARLEATEAHVATTGNPHGLAAGAEALTELAVGSADLPLMGAAAVTAIARPTVKAARRLRRASRACL